MGIKSGILFLFLRSLFSLLKSFPVKIRISRACFRQAFLSGVKGLNPSRHIIRMAAHTLKGVMALTLRTAFPGGGVGHKPVPASRAILALMCGLFKGKRFFFGYLFDKRYFAAVLAAPPPLRTLTTHSLGRSQKHWPGHFPLKESIRVRQWQAGRAFSGKLIF